MEPDAPKPRVSLRDMAKMMGVSHVSISLALRDSPQISAKLREDVQRLAKELGYRPDPMLAALASYSQSKNKLPIHAVIAWINAWPQPEKLRAYREFDLYWKGACAAAEKYGYRLEEFQMNSEFTPQRLHQIFQARGIHGILLPPHGSPPPWEDFPWEEYAVVRYGRVAENPATHLVTSDHVANTIVAFHAMRKRGYRRIGFVTKDMDITPTGHLFAAGFLGVQEMIDAGDRVPLFKFTDHPGNHLVSAFRKWIELHKPDAVLTASEAFPALLAKSGFRVPDDFGLAVLSLLDGGADSGIDQHPEEIGRAGFLLLRSLINDGTRGLPTVLRQILVEGSWVAGTSLPDRSGH